MSGTLLSATLARWLDLIGQAGVIGSLSFELMVLPPGSSELLAILRRLRRVGLVALGLVVVASVAELVGRAATMAGGGMSAGVSALPLVIEKTHFGAIWEVRALAIAVLLLLCTATTRRARMIALAAAVATAATTALTGHAADWGDLRPIAVSDWAHVVASGAWTGGLFCLSFAVLRNADELQDTSLLAAIARRFSRLAAVCVLVVLVTGIANVWEQFANVSALWETPYGRIFTAKVAFVSLLFVLGALNRYSVLPGLSRRDLSATGTRNGERVSRARFSRYVAGEVVLAAVVFACTAFLGQLSPPRHGSQHDSGAHSVQGISDLDHVGFGKEIPSFEGVPKRPTAASDRGASRRAGAWRSRESIRSGPSCSA